MNHLYKIILLLLLATWSVNGQYSSTPTKKARYRILNNSKLYLKGTSNIRNFTCKCQQQFPKSQLEVNTTPTLHTAYFENTAITLYTKNLDCGHPKMNKDMHATLRANQHPSIKIELDKVNLPENWNSNACNLFSTQVSITIAGQTKCEKIIVKAEKTSSHHYRFTSQKTLKMSNYGIQPPSALLGLIQVSDKIDIHLDLHIAVE